MNDVNPYASPTPISEQPELLIRNGAHTVRGLLHRTITFVDPFQAQLNYDGKYFRQRIYIGRVCVWHRISWLRIHPRIEFIWPAEVAGRELPGRIEMKLNHLLQITRFVVFCDDRVLYAEHNGALVSQ